MPGGPLGGRKHGPFSGRPARSRDPVDGGGRAPAKAARGGRRGSSVGRKRAGNPLPVPRSQGRAGLEKRAQQQQERPDDTFLGRASRCFVPLTGVCLSDRSCVLSAQKQKLGRSCWHAAAEEAGHFPGPKRPLILRMRDAEGRRACPTPPPLRHDGTRRQSTQRATRFVTCSSRRLLTAPQGSWAEQRARSLAPEER